MARATKKSASKVSNRRGKLPSWVSGFEDLMRQANAEFWLMTASAEHLLNLASRYTPSQDSRAASYQEVISACLPLASSQTRKHIRLTDASQVEDMTAKAQHLLRWQPSYSLVVAKSLTEGFIQDYLSDRAKTETELVKALDARVKKKKKTTQSKVIENIAQELARGDFKMAADVIDLGAAAKKLSSRLRKYNDIRNHMAHRLGANDPKSGPPLSMQGWQDAIACYTELVALLPPPR